MFHAVNLIEISELAKKLDKAGLLERARILSESVSVRLKII